MSELYANSKNKRLLYLGCDYHEICRLITIKLQDHKSQKTVIFTDTAVGNLSLPYGHKIACIISGNS
jgi:hypothetical protein